MEQFDLGTLVILGIILLSVPAAMAGFFPFVERTIGLLADTLWLKSAKGIIFWLIVIGALVYYFALPRLIPLIRNLRFDSF
jgi:hypothetical protein